MLVVGAPSVRILESLSDGAETADGLHLEQESRHRARECASAVGLDRGPSADPPFEEPRMVRRESPPSTTAAPAIRTAHLRLVTALLRASTARPRSFESTDDEQVDGNVSAIATRIAGTVVPSTWGRDSTAAS